MVDGADLDLPRAQVKRVVVSKIPGGADEKKFSVNKEALLAFSEAAKVFVSLVATTANDVCREHKRQTISAEDVIKAVDELEFGEIVPELKEFLESGLSVGCNVCTPPMHAYGRGCSSPQAGMSKRQWYRMHACACNNL
eukprot:107363-Chlamydomonas_euryale.AAC.3